LWCLSTLQTASLAALLAIIPITGVAIRGDQTLFGYSTATAWETFRVNVVADAARSAGGQILLLFLALLGILSIYPNALRILSRDGRARLGTSAAIAAATAAALMAIYGDVMQRFEMLFPTRLRVSEIGVPAAVGLPFPSIFEAAEALFGAIILTGAVALFVTAMQPWRRRWLAQAVTIGAIFCVSIDIGAGPKEVGLMIVTTALLTAVVWVIARFVLGTNLLAWPAAVCVTSLLQSAGALLQNHRQDLLLHGIVLLALAATVIMWLAATPRRASA
jgi:hypothetical protein